MALVRALTELYHDNRMYEPGAEFEYEGILKGTPEEGMEYVTDDSTANKHAADKKALGDLAKKAIALRAQHTKLKAELEKTPAKQGLPQKVVDADNAATEAETAFANATSAQNHDLV